MTQLLSLDFNETALINEETAICAEYNASKSQLNSAVDSYQTKKEFLKQPLSSQSNCPVRQCIIFQFVIVCNVVDQFE